jgi:hypothetical protein
MVDLLTLIISIIPDTNGNWTATHQPGIID